MSGRRRRRRRPSSTSPFNSAWLLLFFCKVVVDFKLVARAETSVVFSWWWCMKLYIPHKMFQLDESFIIRLFNDLEHDLVASIACACSTSNH